MYIYMYIDMKRQQTERSHKSTLLFDKRRQNYVTFDKLETEINVLGVITTVSLYCELSWEYI